MELLDEINARISEDAIEAGHLATIERLKRKYRDTVIQQQDAAGKTLNRVLKGYDSVVLIFEDNTILYAAFDEGDHDESANTMFITPDLPFFENQGLMSDEDRDALQVANAFFTNRCQAAEDHRLIHQVKARFSQDRLKELFT